MAQSLREKGGLKLTEEEFASLDTEKLVQLQVEQIEREKKELSERLRTVLRRMDHIERAYRREEQPLLAADYERQQAADLANHKRAYEVQRATARERYEHDMAMKKVLSRIMPDYEGMRGMLLEKRRAAHEERVAHAQTQIEKEKEQRRADMIAAREEEERRRAAEEEERAKNEEQRKLRDQEEARLAEKRRADAEREAQLEAQKRAEIEERQAALRHQAEKQAAQQAKAQERLDRDRSEAAARADSAGSWRRGGASSGASDPMFANRRYRPGDLRRQGETRAPESRPPPPSSERPAAGGGGGRYVPGAFARMRQGGGGAPSSDGPTRPPPSSQAPPKDADGFTQVRPRSGNAYRPPSAR